jgi:phosphatidylinositol glycan class O
MFSRGASLLIWVFFVHLAGIYLFTSGFLLTRLSLSEFNDCSSCTSSPTYKRTVFLVIDALRFDFISPNPPYPASPYHHNILKLPAELTAAHPEKSFIFNAYADPPTTTLQRIKGLTTGSLPTFIDMGSNFGGSSIVEDSIITQMERAGKKVSTVLLHGMAGLTKLPRKIAFMGDDTWLSAFPDSFQSNMSFPYDSFNVEDLHTVDSGVTEHLIPLLQDPSKPWDFLIAHFLGVDHVGHRVGPNHPIMKAKLEQMNDVLARTVELLDDDTLLVLIGDHGMDKTGDHGGDGELEVSSAVWIYSKGPVLSHTTSSIPASILPKVTFSGCTVPHRAIQQIDLVPTLSLLLGLPIPFNNLGTIVPELFARDHKGTYLTRALELNAAQVRKYLDTYHASPSGRELDHVWLDFQSAWAATKSHSTDDRLLALNEYSRLALAACRSLWAQFNVVLMIMGLVLLGAGVIACWTLYLRLGEAKDAWDAWLSDILPLCLRGMAGGTIVGILSYLALQSYLDGVDALHCIIFGASLVSSFVFIVSAWPSLSFGTLKYVPVPLILHTLSFFSNSFTIWEDHIILFLLLSTVVPSLLKGFTAPTHRLRYRILGFSALFALCVRLMAISTVCREEQQPFCHVTFYASSSLPSPPLLILILSLPTSLALPYLIRRFLGISKSDQGVALIFLPYVLTPTLLAGNAYWLLEWAESAGLLGIGWNGAGILRTARTSFAWFAISAMLLGGTTLWWFLPLCLHISTDQQETSSKATKHVTILGFANAFGAPYFLFWCIILVFVYTTSQLTGQVVLGLSAFALLAHLEVVDSVRDVKNLTAAFGPSSSSTAAKLDSLGTSSASIQFSEVAPLALLGIHTFYTTGHQSTIPSIHWKSAFLLTSTVTYPFSPLTVLINSFGSHFLFAVASPLLASWNMSPLPHPSSANIVQGQSIRAALGMSLYHSTLLFGSALSAGVLRRHLMVWKIFAPRFMAAVVGMIVVDLAVILGIAIGAKRVRDRVGKIFQGMENGVKNQQR